MKRLTTLVLCTLASILLFSSIASAETWLGFQCNNVFVASDGVISIQGKNLYNSHDYIFTYEGTADKQVLAVVLTAMTSAKLLKLKYIGNLKFDSIQLTSESNP
ncbi:hypothetical protein [Maridesulfovibrio bastinii]|uniref:hypothetical protein n=1 Tax=Maridesulfovibrio bastinii TaxID=47157 RepID=UPI000483286A|nr:hypothetical protein [Maridesulfovibrio bastinii]